MDLRVGRPVASPRFSPRPHRTARFQPPRPPLFGTLCGVTPFGMTFGVPLAPYGRARLVVAGGRMSSGPLVRRLTEPFGRKPCSRGGRPSRTPPSARRGTASPPPADFEKLPYEVAGQQFDVGPPGEERPEVLRKARIVGQMRIDRGGS